MRYCQHCSSPLLQKPTEPGYRFLKRAFCGRACSSAFTSLRRSREHAESLFRNYRVTDSGCWEWLGTRFSSGYGRSKVGYASYRAHRLFFEKARGPIPEGKILLHSCDNVLCVNPDHLSVGTHQENKDDAVRKGRHAHGEQSGNARLSEADALAIRGSKESAARLAKRYGVSRSLVGQIKRGTAWRHLSFLAEAA